MTSLLCKTCRLGCSDYNGCSYLNSSTAASGRSLSQVLKGRYKYWPELPRKGKLALEPPSCFCHRHFCHSPATFPMPFTSLSLANFKTLLFIYVLSSKLSQTATYCFSLCFPLKFHSSLKRQHWNPSFFPLSSSLDWAGLPSTAPWTAVLIFCLWLSETMNAALKNPLLPYVPLHCSKQLQHGDKVLSCLTKI